MVKPNRSIKPPYATAGGGYDFENKVAAFYLACMLSGKPPRAGDMATIETISFQTRVDGWYLDDILLVLKTQDYKFSIAISVKSNRQITTGGFDVDFVECAWKQFLHHETDKFEPANDVMMLAVGSVAQTVNKALNELLGWAKTQTPKDLAAHVLAPGYSTNIKRALFDSLTCPQGLSEAYQISVDTISIEIASLLRCIDVREFDLNSTSSRDEDSARNMCRAVLSSSDWAEASRLWDELCTIALRYRTNGGTVTNEDLIKLLRPKFKFGLLEPYGDDWRKIQAYSEKTISRIPNLIGGRVKVERTELQRQLIDILNKNKIVLVLGASGTGKTCLVKDVSSSLEWPIWIDCKDIVSRQLDSELQLSNCLETTLNVVPSSKATMILDGLEAIDQNSSKNLSKILSPIILNSEDNPWRLIITCQIEEWERVHTELTVIGFRLLQYNELTVGNLSVDDTEQVWKAFPQIISLFKHEHLWPILLNPQILNLIASKSHELPEDEVVRWLGESHLIEWFWERLIRKPPNASSRARFTMDIAVRQADNLSRKIPILEFASSELSSLDELLVDHLLVLEDERLNFRHDSLGDWTRQRILISKQESLKDFLVTRLDSPAWHKSIRLFSLHFLEFLGNIDQWQSYFNCLNENKSAQIYQNLFLDAIISSANPARLLGILWPKLIEDDGILMRRLLRLFLHSATTPNPTMRALGSRLKKITDIDIDSYQRLPIIQYWPPFLSILSTNMDYVLNVVLIDAAEIADAWLRRGVKMEFLLDAFKDAAKLSIGTANVIREWTLESRSGKVLYHTSENEKIIFRALLAAAEYEPEKAEDLLLFFSGEEKQPIMGAQTEIQSSKAKPAQTCRADSVFRNVCLHDPDAFKPLIDSNPGLAKNVLLALLIEKQVENDDGWSHISRRLLNELGLADTHTWKAPIYHKGPFLYFLKRNPDEGLDLIIKLVNYATDQWIKDATQEQINANSVTFKGGDREILWIGNSYVYYWHINFNSPPTPLVIALMALEKWLYDSIDEGKDITHYLERILEESRSVAFAGVLMAIGKKVPGLFKKQLLPLLAVPEFYFWESGFQILQGSSWQIAWGFERQGDVGRMFYKLAEEWHNMTHRKISLEERVQGLFAFDNTIRNTISKCRKAWIRRLSGVNSDGTFGAYLDKLCEIFNFENYAKQNHPDYGECFYFTPPRRLLEKAEEYQSANHVKQVVVSFPVRCSMILERQLKLSAKDLREFLAVLTSIKDAKEFKIEDNTVTREDGLAGGIAVLICQQKDWLIEHEDWHNWCKSTICDIVLNPPTAPPFDCAESESVFHWDAYASYAMPIIFHDDPSNTRVRECMARLVCNYHLKAIEILFRSAGNLRSNIGSEFKRLQHLLMRISAARAFHPNLRSIRDYDKATKLHEHSINEFFESGISSFVTKQLKNVIPEWRRIAEEVHSRITKKSGLKRVEHFPEFEFRYIQAAHRWMPLLSEARDQTERDEWIEFWFKFFSWILPEDNSAYDNRRGDEHFPYEWQRWVIEMVAILYYELEDGKRTDHLWQSMLDLGERGNHWIQIFMYQWFFIRREPYYNEARFQGKWWRMTDWAFHSEKWSPETINRYFLNRKTWSHLLGFGDSWFPIEWRDIDRGLVNQMKEAYIQWAKVFADDLETVFPFILFLQTDAARDLRESGIVEIEKCLKAEMNKYIRYGDRKDIEDSMTLLLEKLYSENRIALRTDNSLKASFKSCLAYLVERQNPKSLVLNELIARDGF